MQFTDKEKKLLGLIAVVAVVCVVLPGFGDNYSAEYLLSQKRQVKNLQDELAKYEADIAGIDKRRQLLQANRQDYIKWVNKGVVGQQNPIEWVKIMDQIQRGRGLFPATYKFSDEEVVSPENFPLTSASSINMVFWRMELSMEMLHDLDVFMFLEDLNSRSESFFFPVECSFSRKTANFELSSRENMSSSCSIDWVSVKDPARRWGKEDTEQQS